MERHPQEHRAGGLALRNSCGEFVIADFQPPAAKLLGEGVFGRVYDLNDGTVLKIARGVCAGIGSGAAKIAHEYAALTLLAANAEPPSFVPRPRGHGAIPASSPLAGEGFSHWLRSTKLAGTPLAAHNIKTMSGGERWALGDAIGAGLARLHAALAEAIARTAMPEEPSGDDAYAEILEVAREIGDPLYLGAIAALQRARSRVPPAILDRASHSDVNISNWLFGPDREVCGVVDFAEWGRDFPEKDLSDILHELPELGPPLLATYEREANFRPDPYRLALGAAENALYGAIIGERLRAAEDVQAARAMLAAQLKILAVA